MAEAVLKVGTDNPKGDVKLYSLDDSKVNHEYSAIDEFPD